MRAIKTAKLPPKARAKVLTFADAIRSVSQNREATLADQLSMLVGRTGYRAMLRESRADETVDQLENLQELLTLGGSFHTATELLDHAALASAAPGETVDGRVEMMTLHKGKGLEFPHVFLAGWDTGSFPSTYGDHDEERRLAYVALTRGMQRVAVTHVTYRGSFALPSPFIEDIPAANRVAGWLGSQGRPHADQVAPRQMAALDDTGLRRDGW